MFEHMVINTSHLKTRKPKELLDIQYQGAQW
jgi:hypothetical protein